MSGGQTEAIVHEYEHGMFPFKLVIITDERAAKPMADRLGVDLPDDHGGNFSLFAPGREGNPILMCLDAGDDEYPAVAAHEAVHVKQIVADVIGEQEFGTETEAYLVQWVVACALDAKAKQEGGEG